MPDPTNLEIAAALDELGDLYELDGAIVHRVVAYRNAAKAVRDASVSITALARDGRATEQVELAGSARRMADSVKDLDVIATATDPLALAQAATALELIESAGTPGTAGVRLRTHTGLPVDLDRRPGAVRQPAPALHRL